MVDVLIIGAKGLIGGQVVELCNRKGLSWMGTQYKRPDRNSAFLDITDKKEVSSLVEKINPKIVFHCANLAGGVDFCENNPAMAEKFHYDGTKNIGEATAAAGASLVFFSSDYVFDGKKGKAYMETDDPKPLNIYGRLKLKAEEWIRENVQKYFILRTTNVYGWDPETVTPNFLMGLYRKAVKGEECGVPSYLWGNPTLADDLAEAAFKLTLMEAHGVYHAVSHEYISRYHWAEKFFKTFELDTALLKETDKPAEIIAVPRPLKSNLDNTKLVHQLGFAFKGVDDGLNVCLSKFRNIHP